MKRSTVPDHILQQLDNIIGVWQENPDFRMGPEVTLETMKAIRAQLDTCIMDVQTTNRTLTKQINDRDDCGKLANEYGVRARRAIQGYFGPNSTQYRGRYPPKRSQDDPPKGQDHRVPQGGIRRHERRGGGSFRIRRPRRLPPRRREG